MPELINVAEGLWNLHRGTVWGGLVITESVRRHTRIATAEDLRPFPHKPRRGSKFILGSAETNYESRLLSACR